MAESSPESTETDDSTRESESTETNGESLDVNNENYVQVLDPQTDTENDELTPALWGRFWGMGSGNAVAFYWVFDPELLRADDDFDDPIPADNEDGNPESAADDEETTEGSSELFDESYFAVFGEPASLETYDPSLTRGAFKKRLLDYTVADVPVPKVAIEDLRETIEDYLEKPKVVWLEDFISSNDTAEINGWFSRLLEELEDDDYRYQLRGQLIDPEAEDEQLERQTSSEIQENEAEEDDGSSAQVLNISLMTDPTNGVEPTELLEGMEVYFRIVGNVDFLPEKLIDRERQEPASTPMTGSIVSIESNPDIPGDRDAEPENYRMLEVEIEPEIHGEALAFKDDRIKVPIDDDDEDDFETRDIILLGVIVGILVLILVLLFSL